MDPDPGGPKIYGSGSATLEKRLDSLQRCESGRAGSSRMIFPNRVPIAECNFSDSYLNLARVTAERGSRCRRISTTTSRHSEVRNTSSKQNHKSFKHYIEVNNIGLISHTVLYQC
jgi:hypothetical protein